MTKPKAKVIRKRPAPPRKLVQVINVNDRIVGLDNRGALWALDFVPSQPDGVWVWKMFPELPR